MAPPSTQASNAIIYVTYVVFLCFGLWVGWRFSKTKGDFLSSLRTQTALPLALNFSASAMGAGILYTYPEVAGVAGLQGILTYAFASSLPFFTFPPLAKRLRKLCPHGFVLTEFVRERFGLIACLFLSACSCLTMFIYMISELTSVSGAINALTGLNGLPATIVEVVVTLLYTAFGGFRTSLITDNVQGVMIILLLIICAAAIGTQTHIDKAMVEASGLLNASKLGWQLLYILPVAIIFNNYFLSGYWQRAFSSKTDRDLWLGCTGAAVIVFVFLSLVGATGLLAVWGGVIEDLENDASYSFFLLLATMKPWVIGFVLVFTISLSCAAYDTLQTALVATISNDVFRNKISIWWVRCILVVNVPAVIVAAKNLDILVLYLISDLLSAAIVPPILLGLIPALNFLHGFDVIVGGLGGLLTVFIFGTIYYGNAADGAGVLILKGGIYSSDWSTFGAFVAAPFGSLLWTAIGFAARALYLVGRARMNGGPRPDIWAPKTVDTARFAAEAEQAGVFDPQLESRVSDGATTASGAYKHDETTHAVRD